MSALDKENAIAPNTFSKNGLYFTITKALDIDFTWFTAVSFTNEAGQAFGTGA